VHDEQPHLGQQQRQPPPCNQASSTHSRLVTIQPSITQLCGTVISFTSY
jgi:hypothetical protein